MIKIQQGYLEMIEIMQEGYGHKNEEDKNIS